MNNQTPMDKTPTLRRILDMTYQLTQKNDPIKDKKDRLLRDWIRYWDKMYMLYHEIPKGKKRSMPFKFDHVKIAGKLKISAETNDLSGDIKITFRDGREIALIPEKTKKDKKKDEKNKGQYYYMKNNDYHNFLCDLCDIHYIESVLKPNEVITDGNKTEICKNVTIETTKKKDDPPKPPDAPNQAFLVEYQTGNKTFVCVKIIAESNEQALKIAQLRYHPKSGPAKVTPWNFVKDEQAGDPKMFD